MKIIKLYFDFDSELEEIGYSIDKISFKKNAKDDYQVMKEFPLGYVFNLLVEDISRPLKLNLNLFENCCSKLDNDFIDIIKDFLSELENKLEKLIFNIKNILIMTILIDGFFNSFDVKNKIKTILNKAFHSNNKNTIIITYIKWNTKNNKNIWDILKNDIKYFITNNYIFDNISINVIKNNNNITSYIINILNKTYILKLILLFLMIHLFLILLIMN